MKNLLLISFLLLLTSAGAVKANEARVTINATDTGLAHVPVHADFPAGTFDAYTPFCIDTDSGLQPAQLETLDNGQQRIWWIANQPAGTQIDASIRTGEDCPRFTEFRWQAPSPRSSQLLHGHRPILQYEHPVFNSGDIEATKKPYHHVFDPESGEKITKGVGGLYSHHRGIFFGYNHVYVDNGDEQIDIWHANDGERSEHEAILTTFAGPVMGGHVVRILWKDHDGEPFAEERREIRAFPQPDGNILIDFKTEMHPHANHVKLDGDRQHAGVQFRASQHVADNPEQSRYIRPDGWAHLDPDEEVGDDNNTGFGWNAFSFRIEDRPYTVTYMSHPDNPEPAEMSERLYGRFGEFFRYELTPDNPLNARYRFWISTGDTPGKEQILTRYHNYGQPPNITRQ